MGTAAGESKLFHAIVVVGLSFASSACGATEGSVDEGGNRDSSAATAVDGANTETAPDAASDALASIDSAPMGTISLGSGGTAEAGTEIFCRPDSGGPDAGHCAWPVFL
jgi:hypothetical protein